MSIIRHVLQALIGLRNFANVQDEIASGNTTTIDDSTNQVIMVRCNATNYIEQCMSLSTYTIIVRREEV